MERIKNVRRSDILRTMEIMQEVFDIVRLVNPDKSIVIAMMKGKAYTAPNEPCFSVWERMNQCEDCASRKAYVTETRVTKVEWYGDNSYSVVAIPYVVEDQYGKQKMVLELVNKISDELIFAMKKSEVTKARLDNFKRMLYIDSLTEIYNRRYYDDRAFMEELAIRKEQSLGILMINILRFKRINDEYGYIKGDIILQHVTSIIQSNIGEEEILMRIGADEFLILFPSATEQEIEKCMESLKAQVTQHVRDEFLGESKIKINIGFAFVPCFNGQEEQMSRMIDCADQDMYRDKRLS